MRSRHFGESPEMAKAPAPTPLPDAPARLAALTDHDRTLLVEAGAGSGKTALMAGRVSLLIGAGVHPKEIVAITFTEAAASELLERIERFVQLLLGGEVPVELREALPQGLTTAQHENLESGARALDEITCTTIHGFCQQLVKPYPVETGIDPGAAIIDPAAAQIVYQDLMEAWLSARFGRDRGAEGLGRIPPIADAGGEEDFFTELLMKAPDETLELISKTAQFLKLHRTAHAPAATVRPSTFMRLAEAIGEFATWYNGCGVAEPTTGDLIEDLARVATLAREAAAGPLTGRRIAELLFHTAPTACKKDETAFKQWGRKGKWKEAAKGAGRGAAHGDQLSATGESIYLACGAAYRDFCANLGALAFQRFVVEFDALKNLYRDYKRKAALLDFDDLLHHARDLLKGNEPVRQALARRFPRILVDEFQDTDPLQAEIIWRLAGDGDAGLPWLERAIRPGALFLVGDPKQAIYRFRGADVDTYIAAKQVLAARDPGTMLEITANFRSQAPILDFINSHFSSMLDRSQGQPGFTALTPVRERGAEPSVAAFEIALDGQQRSPRGDLVVDLVRHQEAGIVAAILRRLIGAYPVWDSDLHRFRPARAGDIALLAPTGTSLWIYERALEAREIPIATQAGKGFFRRQEVQDLIAAARAIADRRDTFALGALLRGPLVGLTEEEIADEIASLQNAAGTTERLHLWTDPSRINNPVLKQTMLVLQNLARKARRTTPYQLLAEAVEELQVRPILSARHPRGAERALANVELVLEMARAYAARGIADFARALWERWADEDAQTEGRPDAEANAVSLITIHSAKGLEWPIVIPINSTTSLWSDTHFLYRRLDDTVHFRVFDFPSIDYDTVAQTEKEAQRRERVRLWYVALTRARDLLLLPRQTERIPGDWLSLVTLDINALPLLDLTNFNGSLARSSESTVNVQDLPTWKREAAIIAASERRIVWHQPSRHEGPENPAETTEEIFVGPEAVLERLPTANDERKAIQGGRERGLILHKLLEEVLTRETDEDVAALQARAAELLAQLGLADAEDATTGLSSSEMASTVHRALQLPDVAALRPRLKPEFRVYAGVHADQKMSLTTGIADAVASDERGRVEAVIDWKSDVDPMPGQIEIYRAQVRDYLAATGAQHGLVVFLTSNLVERISI
ncbi:MAG: UvrD-helicase domain-containing protein [Candidatus Acidiferrales bacterium]